MPIYEFKCGSCGNVEEHLLRFSEAKPTQCAQCQGTLTQLISQTTFALKGSGWYVTDYKSKPTESSSSAGSSTSTAASKPAEPACSTGGCAAPAASCASGSES